MPDQPDQAIELRLAQDAAKAFRIALSSQQKLRQQNVGESLSDIDEDGRFTGSTADQPVWFGMPFDPKRPPVKNRDGDTEHSDRDWQKVKE